VPHSRMPESAQQCNDNSSDYGSVGPTQSSGLGWTTPCFARTRISGGRAMTAAEMNSLALLMYQGRRDRDRFFDADLFSEPAWDILLAAYCLPTPQRPLSVTGLCYASAVPQTTALRWITHLCDKGLLQRSNSRTDSRMCFVTLTQKGKSQMEAHLCSIADRLTKFALLD
jgi:DNA-binding MarR family transcriptional regulator